jgi:23S rRNA pseudouridine2605 synthase
MQQRLQKILASAGIASRRSCEAIIAAGRVTVNGVRATEPGIKADPETDDIRLDGKPIGAAAPYVYIVLNKPVGYVSTVQDPHAERTVMELVRGIPARIYPVGRLDADTAGLLLLTNDGVFTERLTHPRHQVPKTYRALVRGDMDVWAATDLRKGILLEDGMTAPALVEWVDYNPQHNATTLDITIHEGRNRQVRRMLDAVGYPVLALTRIRVGPIDLKGLAPGTWRKLRPAEVEALLSCADSAPPSLPQMPREEEERGGEEEKRRRKEKREMGVRPSPGRAREEAIRAEAEALNARLRTGDSRAGTNSKEPPSPRKKSASPSSSKAQAKRARNPRAK